MQNADSRLQHPASPIDTTERTVAGVVVPPNLGANDFAQFLLDVRGEHTPNVPVRSLIPEQPIPPRSVRSRSQSPLPSLEPGEREQPPSPKRQRTASQEPDRLRTPSPQRRRAVSPEPDRPRRHRRRRSQDERSNDEDGEVVPPAPKRRGQRMHIPPPTYMAVAHQERIQYNIPPFHDMNRDTRVWWLGEIRKEYGKIARDYPHILLPKLEENPQADYLRQQYIWLSSATQQTLSAAWAERWRVGVVLMFCGIEYVLTQLIGIDVTGLAKMTYNSKFFVLFDQALLELGSQTGVSFAANYSPLTRIAIYTVMNVLFVFMVRALSSSMSVEGAESIMTAIMELFVGDPRALVAATAGGHQAASSSTPTTAPRAAPRPNTSFAGMNLGTVLANATSGLNQAMGVGGMAGAAEPEAERRPRWRRYG